LPIVLLACFDTSGAFTGFCSTLDIAFTSDFYSSFASLFLLGFDVSILDFTPAIGSGTSSFDFDFFSSFLG
jgi:hypothetical protein